MLANAISPVKVRYNPATRTKNPYEVNQSDDGESSAFGS